MTSDPKTLLQMAGADLNPGAVSNAALVLIDCQNEYIDGALALPGVAPALAEAARVLERVRAAGSPVFHVVHEGQAGGVFDLAGHSGTIAEVLTPRDGEAVVTKKLPNAFADTNLNPLLEKIGVKELIFMGFMTHMCVSSTVRCGLDLGYRSTIVANACATRDLPAPDGGVVSAADIHRTALAELADRFAIIAPDAAALSD